MVISSISDSMYRFFILIILLICCSSCNSSFIDKINPSLVAKVNDYKIYKNEVNKRITDENSSIKITKPIFLFYLNEIIKEAIIDNEFKKLGFKITESDKKNANILSQLNKDELIRYIKFKKVRQYVVRRLTPPSTQQCYSYYKTHFKEFNHDEKVKIKYIIFNQENNYNNYCNDAKKNLSLDYIVKKYNLKYTFKGIIKLKNIPDEIQKKINFEKKNSVWCIKSEAGYLYIIKVENLYKKIIPFENVKKLISEKLLETKRKKVFNYWLKEKLKSENITIYYNKI
jgi:hypothetical protein